MDDSSICAVTLNDDWHCRDKVFLKRITAIDDDNTNKIIIIFYIIL